MAKNQSDKSRFESRFGGGWITDAAFLAESMLAKQARLKNIDLPNNFWNLDRWKRDYKLQMMHANALLKLYSIETIIRVLRSAEAKRTISLKAPWLDPLFKTEQAKLDRQAAQMVEKPPTPPELPKEIEKPRPAFVPKKSALDKLRGLDG